MLENYKKPHPSGLVSYKLLAEGVRTAQVVASVGFLRVGL